VSSPPLLLLPKALTTVGCSKLVTTVVSTFTSYYVHLWPSFFPGNPLSPPLPSFDGRAVQYPSTQNLRDYMSWRQVDCLWPHLIWFLFSSVFFSVGSG